MKDGDGRWNRKEIAVPRALESYYDVIALLVKSVHRLIQMYKKVCIYNTGSQFSLILVIRHILISTYLQTVFIETCVLSVLAVKRLHCIHMVNGCFWFP